MKIHSVMLSNGQVLLVEESNGMLHIASQEGEQKIMPEDEIAVEYYVCSIDKHGVLVMPNSGSTTEDLVEGLE